MENLVIEELPEMPVRTRTPHLFRKIRTTTEKILMELIPILRAAAPQLAQFRSGVPYHLENKDIHHQFWWGFLFQNKECDTKHKTLGTESATFLITPTLSISINKNTKTEIVGETLKTLIISGIELSRLGAILDKKRAKEIETINYIGSIIAEALVRNYVEYPVKQGTLEILETAVQQAWRCKPANIHNYQDAISKTFNTEGPWFEYFILYNQPEYVKRRPEVQKVRRFHKALFLLALQEFQNQNSDPSNPDPDFDFGP